MEAVCFNACTACTPDNINELNAAAFDARVLPGGNIQLDLAPMTESAVLRITSMSGALVGEWNVPAGANRYDITTGIDADGVYLVSLTRAGQRMVQKLVLTH
jgi:hypothetical protein